MNDDDKKNTGGHDTGPIGDGALPSARAVPARRGRLSLVWLVPLTALGVGVWLVIQSFLSHGPDITIRFLSGDGIEAGKTRIKYKDVDVGEVKSVSISADRKWVLVKATLSSQARDFAVEDTRFWVVKPRVAAGNVSGLSTLLSGAYIGIDVGKSESSRRDFDGLEVPPMLVDGLKGTRFVLHANDLGSIDYGSPIYYRKLPVGQVIAYDLDADGRGVTMNIFVRAPYDRFVTEDTRFWNTSGLDFTVDASGLRFNTESLTTLLAGGIAFGAPTGDATKKAATGANFLLFDDERTAMREHDRIVEHYTLVFHQSVHGLAVGAPVEFRGIQFGEVTSIGLTYDSATQRADVPIDIKVFPERLYRYTRSRSAAAEAPRLLASMIQGGLRGQLRTANLLTGQLYVALDFFPGAARVKFDSKAEVPEIPTVEGSLNQLEASISTIARKLEKVPFDEIGQNLKTALESLDKTVKDADTLMQTLNREVAPEFKRTIEEARQTVSRAERLLQQDSPLQVEMRDTLREVGRAAQSLRTLTEYLDQHPEALIRGRTTEEAKP